MELFRARRTQQNARPGCSDWRETRVQDFDFQ
jgi:hypothetical protein